MGKSCFNIVTVKVIVYYYSGLLQNNYMCSGFVGSPLYFKKDKFSSTSASEIVPAASSATASLSVSKKGGMSNCYCAGLF